MPINVMLFKLRFDTRLRFLKTKIPAFKLVDYLNFPVGGHIMSRRRIFRWRRVFLVKIIFLKLIIEIAFDIPDTPQAAPPPIC